MIIYGIMCHVSGGVTGPREGWLKSDGKPVEFATMAEAQAEATRQQQAAEANSRYTTARFSYVARPLKGWET